MKQLSDTLGRLWGLVFACLDPLLLETSWRRERSVGACARVVAADVVESFDHLEIATDIDLAPAYIFFEGTHELKVREQT